MDVLTEFLSSTEVGFMEGNEDLERLVSLSGDLEFFCAGDCILCENNTENSENGCTTCAEKEGW